MLSDASWTYIILARYAHVLCAGLLVGGTFFLGVLLPGDAAEANAAEPSPSLRARRGFKMLAHTCILLLLVSGIYNTLRYWPAYRLNMPWTHALFGPHLILGLVIFAILLFVLASRMPRAGERRWLRICVALLFLTILVASSLKYARENPKPHQEGAQAHPAL